MYLSSKTVLASSGAVLLLAACQSGGAETVTPLSPDLVGDVSASEVRVTDASNAGDETLADTLKGILEEKLAECATGETPVIVEALVSEYDDQDGAMTMLVGDNIRLKGSVRLLDPETEDVLADYDISRSVGGGGLIAMAAMSDSARNLSKSFADELCERITPN